MEEDSLFKTPHHEPLAERLRPKTLDEFQDSSTYWVKAKSCATQLKGTRFLP